MTIKIEVIEQKTQPVLAIKTITNVAELPKVIGESFSKIMEYLTELGEHPTVVPYTAYFNLDMDKLKVEMGFPVSKAFPAKDDIEPGEIPAGKYVAYLYKGPYMGMEEPYNQMFKYMEENGYKSTGVYYEYYLNSPHEVPESELLTRIVMPVK